MCWRLRPPIHRSTRPRDNDPGAPALGLAPGLPAPRGWLFLIVDELIFGRVSRAGYPPLIHSSVMPVAWHSYLPVLSAAV